MGEYGKLCRRLADAAARGNQNEIVSLLPQFEKLGHYPNYLLAAVEACEAGHRHTAAWTEEEHFKLHPHLQSVAFFNDVFAASIRGGHLEMVKWCFERVQARYACMTYTHQDVATMASRFGHIEIVEWALPLAYAAQGAQEPTDLLNQLLWEACNNDQIAFADWCLEHMRRKNYEVDYHLAMLGAAAGNWPLMMEWCMEKSPALNLPEVIADAREGSAPADSIRYLQLL